MAGGEERPASSPWGGSVMDPAPHRCYRLTGSPTAMERLCQASPWAVNRSHHRLMPVPALQSRYLWGGR